MDDLRLILVFQHIIVNRDYGYSLSGEVGSKSPEHRVVEPVWLR